MKRLREGGFTLIEIAIAIVVLALLLAGVLGPMSTRVEQAERERTRAMLEEIKEALYGFAIAQGRLPCPDSDGSNDGREDRTTACTGGVVVGNLPWADLAVPELDAWGRRFLYRVTPSYADDVGLPTFAPPVSCPAPPPATPPSQSSFALCSDGDISVRDEPENPPGGTPCDNPPLPIDVAQNVPAVVLSYGKHRFDPSDAAAPPSCFEIENFENLPVPPPPGDTDEFFVARGYAQGTGQGFDDLVVWISPHILKNRMIMAGKLP